MERAVGERPETPFAERHHGQAEADLRAMLDALGVDSLDALIDRVVPESVRVRGALELAGLDAERARTEQEAQARLAELAGQNRVMRSMIGQGYHGTQTPPVIRRNILENPLWYTPYTPYQAEIAQGRLEALINFQTVVSDLTALPLANASLLDEATAAAEAIAMAVGIGRQKRLHVFVDAAAHPQTLRVVRTRAAAAGLTVHTGPAASFDPAAADVPADAFAAVLVQYPGTDGAVPTAEALRNLAARAHEHGLLVIAAADPLALTVLDAPGDWGADIAVGSTQRFGVPMGAGGPHAAYLATRAAHARKMPGRLIGLSRDARGTPAYRMAIQTREQHIKREKATSNICTAQVLLAITAGFYAVYHGSDGLQRIARHAHDSAVAVADAARAAGWRVRHDDFFDNVCLDADDAGQADRLMAAGVARGINFRRLADAAVCICTDQTTTADDVAAVAEALGDTGTDGGAGGGVAGLLDRRGLRDMTGVMAHPTFHRHRTEHALLRYAHRLIGMDYGLAHGMIPLGSCTMKLNAAAEMEPITWPGFADIHPFAPADQQAGYATLYAELESWLASITGFDAVSLQPNAGSQGEYAGLLTIRRLHDANGDTDRRVCLIPTSAHGTNPASAVIAGLEVVGVACADNGDIDLDDLRAKAEAHADRLAALMITYPSTHGVFEAGVREACETVHRFGGRVYMDGANLNAQVGLTTPGALGADVCHLNLHKTFCIPHGGGGPGMGPIGCTAELAPHLPGGAPGDDDAYHVSAAPYGSPMILPITHAYIQMMGARGLTEATRRAILNANYMAHRLRGHFDILYTAANGTVAHEFILDCRPFDDAAGVTVDDIAKRLMDYGFHGPTMSWPVAGTLMVEPTESETRAELDRFCDAMIAIRDEIRRVEDGAWPADDNPLKHAPHPATVLLDDTWAHPYPRRLATHPAAGQDEPGAKFWPAVARIDNPHGDRNLHCTCSPVEL